MWCGVCTCHGHGTARALPLLQPLGMGLPRQWRGLEGQLQHLLEALSS